MIDRRSPASLVFVLSDDHRYDFMGFHPKGPKWIETPAMDRMAREGVHLANAFGVPVVAIYGPTNPIRTGPLYEAPTVILQPPGCPPTGGMPIDGVSPNTVVEAVEKTLESA